MKTKLRILACALASVAIGQSAVKAFANEAAAKVTTPELEAKVVIMLQQKTYIEGRGGTLSADQQAELVRSLKQLTDRAKKTQLGLMDHESPGA